MNVLIAGGSLKIILSSTGMLQGMTGICGLSNLNTIIFDKPTSILKSVCFTGERGSKQKDCQIRKLNNGAEIVSDRALSEREGLTIAVAVAKSNSPKLPS